MGWEGAGWGAGVGMLLVVNRIASSCFSFRWLRCEEPAKPSNVDPGTYSAPSGACVAGPAANIFVTHGGDDDFAFDVEEATEAEAALREVLQRDQRRCVLLDTARAASSFSRVVDTSVGLLTRTKYQSAWVPCVLKGLRERGVSCTPMSRPINKKSWKCVYCTVRYACEVRTWICPEPTKWAVVVKDGARVRRANFGQVALSHGFYLRITTMCLIEFERPAS